MRSRNGVLGNADKPSKQKDVPINDPKPLLESTEFLPTRLNRAVPRDVGDSVLYQSLFELASGERFLGSLEMATMARVNPYFPEADLWLAPNGRGLYAVIRQRIDETA